MDIKTYNVFCEGISRLEDKTLLGVWSFYIDDFGFKRIEKLKEKFGIIIGKKTPEMELEAVILGIDEVNRIKELPDKVIIYTQSKLILDCYLKEQYVEWKKRGWKTYAFGGYYEIPHKEQWLTLIPYFQNPRYSFREPSKSSLEMAHCSALSELAIQKYLGASYAKQKRRLQPRKRAKRKSK